MPVGVRKLRSTTTGVEVGFSNDMESVLAAAVEPPAKYHWGEVVAAVVRLDGEDHSLD